MSVKTTCNVYTVQIHGLVDLECSITGHPKPRLVYWIKVDDGKHKLVRSPTKVPDYSPTEQNGYVLKIEDAVDLDAGIYKCIAVINDSEIHSKEIHLFVSGGNIHMMSSWNQTKEMNFRDFEMGQVGIHE